MSRPVIHVKIELVENIFGGWRIALLIVTKDGQPYPVTLEEQVFENRVLAKWDAKMRARWFLRQNLDIEDHGDIAYHLIPPPHAEESRSRIRGRVDEFQAESLGEGLRRP